MKINKINEEKLISLIFENKNNLYDLKNSIYTEFTGAALDSAKEKAKVELKDAAKGILNFAAFNIICERVAKNLNKTWQLKNTTGNMVKDIYKESILILRFFYSSKYKLIVWRGFTKYYSWDLAMACILMFESFKNDKQISYALQQAKNINPAFLKNQIIDFYNKIKNKTIIIDPKSLDVVDTTASLDGSRSTSSIAGTSKIEVDKIILFLKPQAYEKPEQLKNILEVFRSRGTNAETQTFINNCSVKLDTFEAEWNSISNATSTLFKNEILRSYIVLPFANRIITILDRGGNKISIPTSTTAPTIVDVGFNFESIQSYSVAGRSAADRKTIISIKKKFIYLYLFLNLKNEEKRAIEKIITELKINDIIT